MKYIKIFIWDGVLINGNGGNGWQFFLRSDSYTLQLGYQSNMRKCRLTEDRTKPKKIPNSNHKLKRNTREIMFIRAFVLKEINNGRKFLTHHDILDCIAEQIVLVITRHQIFWFMQTYGGQVSHLLIHLSSLSFVL